jgi:uncharacterized protein (DUF1810 family)
MTAEQRPLSRFVDAQEGGVYERALAEIRAGRKRSHWMWFVFPQIEELGHSETAKFYGIQGFDEAIAYLAHTVLGGRLREICAALLELDTCDAYAVFGSPDNLKLRSSMTLFEFAAPHEPLFTAVLEKFYNGTRCHRTEQHFSEV